MSGDGTEGVQGRFAGTVGGFQIVAEFALRPRAITALTGPSGAGKSTLLRCVAGLTRLDGRLTVDGEVWQDATTFLPPHRRAVGMVFQDAGLLPHLSVRDNLMFGARRSRGGPEVVFDDIVELLGLSSLLGRSPKNLSGGERQRVALGRALLSRPRLLLMDEPLSSLDAESKGEILPYLERLHETLSIPALFVSHDSREVARLADSVLIMRQGRIVEMMTQDDAQERDRAQLLSLAPEARDRLALAALQAGLDPAD